MIEQGRKFDGGKLRYDLVPVLAFEDQVKGLTYGVTKYDDNNWRVVPEGRKRYLAAAMRHIQEYRKGNLWDHEQEIHHLSAAINNFSFIVEKDLQGWEDTTDVVEEGSFKIPDLTGMYSIPSIGPCKADWIVWEGGDCPVSVDCRVEFKIRNGQLVLQDSAKSLRWVHENEDDDIVAYKILKG